MLTPGRPLPFNYFQPTCAGLVGFISHLSVAITFIPWRRNIMRQNKCAIRKEATWCPRKRRRNTTQWRTICQKTNVSICRTPPWLRSNMNSNMKIRRPFSCRHSFELIVVNKICGKAEKLGKPGCVSGCVIKYLYSVCSKVMSLVLMYGPGLGCSS